MMATALLYFAEREAEALADILGFVDVSKVPVSHLERAENVIEFQMKMATISELQRAAMLSCFIALYMPQLVDAFLNPEAGCDPLMNAYSATLLLQEPIKNPYVAKYILVNQEQGKEIIQGLAMLQYREIRETDESLKELLTVAVRTTTQNDLLGGIGTTFRLLNSLIALQTDGSACIDKSLREDLLRYVKRWAREWRGHEVSRDFDDTIRALSSSTDPITELEMDVKCKYMENLRICGRSGCKVEHNLQQCERCKTVRYCSREHQVDDWKDPERPHKAFCHRTTW